MSVSPQPQKTGPASADVDERAAVVDPFSDSLLYLAAHHGRALSREALLAGLPVENNRLGPSLYERAARRAAEAVLRGAGLSNCLAHHPHPQRHARA